MGFWDFLKSLFGSKKGPSPQPGPSPAPTPTPAPAPAPPPGPPASSSPGLSVSGPVRYGAALTANGLERVKARLGVGEAEIWTVLTVEAKGVGFMPSRLPYILYERHIFSKETARRYDESHPDISNRQPGGYVGGAGEYPRIVKAAGLDYVAALRSASWGAAQVMGFNAPGLEYPSVEVFVDRLRTSEDEHLESFMRFIVLNGLTAPLKAHDWRGFAKIYNGPNYEAGGYHTKLANAYAKFSSAPSMNLDLRAAQLYLGYLGYDPKGIDGLWGPGTKGALTAFLTAHGQSLPPGGLTGLPSGALDLLAAEVGRLPPPAWPL
ncbi:MAG: DUF3380 domain-containing protein [Alphaproteobacteria bacterium]|nr:DUF3380 domain-containing protein [Alphaproteobacteria bacterium]